MTNASIVFSSEKGGSGKTTIAVNVTSYISHLKEDPTLLVDGDTRNQTATKMLIPSAKNDEIEQLEKSEMVITTENIINGIFKNQTAMIDTDEIIEPLELAARLCNFNDPLSHHIFTHFPEETKIILQPNKIDSVVDQTQQRIITKALAIGLTNVLYHEDLYNEEIIKEHLQLLNYTGFKFKPDTLQKLNDTEKMRSDLKFRMEANRQFLGEIYPSIFKFNYGLPIAYIFNRLGYRSTPTSPLPVNTLSLVPSKGRAIISDMCHPSQISREMDEINRCLQLKFSHVFYDTEATSNTLKNVLISMSNTEMIAVATPSNLNVEIDMLKKYMSEILVRGIILNNVLPDQLEEAVAEIQKSQLPLLSVIPMDIDGTMANLSYRNKLVIGTNTCLDYPLRITALHVLNRTRIEQKDIHRIFNEPKNLYEEMMKKRMIAKPVEIPSKNPTTQQKDKTATKKSTGKIRSITSLFNKKIGEKPVAPKK